jgi:RNA polymerase sporulation-specific sigma factor
VFGSWQEALRRAFPGEVLPEADRGELVWEKVLLARAGDEDAVRQLFAICEPALQARAKRYAYLLEREDLAQEGRMGIWEAIEAYRGEIGSSFLSFALMCATRHMVTAIRHCHMPKRWPGKLPISLDQAAYREREKGEGVRKVLRDVIPAGVLQVPDPAEAVAEREEVAWLLTFMPRRLSALELEVARLRLQGARYEDIVARLGVSYKAVDNAVQRLRRKLRRALVAQAGPVA